MCDEQRLAVGTGGDVPGGQQRAGNALGSAGDELQQPALARRCRGCPDAACVRAHAREPGYVCEDSTLAVAEAENRECVWRL